MLLASYYRDIFNIILLFILVFVIQGCDYNKTTVIDNKTRFKNKYSYTLQKSKIINIPIPESSNYRSRYILWYNNKNTNKKYLLRLNETHNGIEFIDFQRKKISFVIRYEKVGPNGIGRLRAFYVVNLDSIYLTSLSRTKIYLTDTTTKIKKVFNIANNRFEFGDFYCTTDNKIIFNENIFYISTLPVAGIDRNPKLFFTSKVSFSYNILKSKVSLIPVTYPDCYLEKRFTSSGFIFFSRTYNQMRNELVYTFPATQSLVVYKISDNTLLNKPVKSAYVETITPINDKNTSFKKGRHHYLETPKYYKIAFDKYLNIYYRFVLLPIETEQTKDYHPFLHFEMPFSIIVLDDDFNILIEQKFEKKIYDCSDYFINEQGLWISNNNSYNPEFDENRISYTLFELAKNEK